MLLVNCATGEVSSYNSGYPLVLSRGPDLPAFGTTLIVRAISGEGTGYEQHVDFILGGKTDEIVRLWSAVTYERDQAMPSRGGTEVRKSVRISRTGDTLYVSGYSKGMLYESYNDTWTLQDSIAVNPEAYCWIVSDLQFKPCNAE